MQAHQLQQVIPHRPPFLLVDRIIEWGPGQRAVGLKNVSANEPALAGHFPGYPLFPGVLIIEALAQVGAALLLRDPTEKRLPVFAGIDKVRFRRPVHPGDQLLLEVTFLQRRDWTGKASAKATTEGQVVAEGELRFALIANPMQNEEG